MVTSCRLLYCLMPMFLAIALSVGTWSAAQEDWPALTADAEDNQPLHDDWCDCDTCSASGYVGPSSNFFPQFHFFDLKHSTTDGRWSGKGQPLHGTSWLNRPYGVSLEGGAFFMPGRIAPHVRSNNDMMAALTTTWDWDHYWGSQMRLGWTAPRLGSGTDFDEEGRNLFMYDASLVYYPWGDSRVRPYYRAGVGLTTVDFPNEEGRSENASMFTLPFAVGLKYQSQRWMATRIELADYLAFGQNGASTINNFTLTFGIEWRYGGRAPSRWSSPSANRQW